MFYLDLLSFGKLVLNQ